MSVMSRRATEILDLEQRINKKKEVSQYIKIYCSIDAALGVIFCVWAAIHLIEGIWDIGIIAWRMCRNCLAHAHSLLCPCPCSALLLIAAALGLLAVRCYEQDNDDKARQLGKVHCIMIVVTHFLLCASFTAGTAMHAMSVPRSSMGVSCSSSCDPGCAEQLLD